MKKSFNRVLSFILTLLMLVSMVPVFALTATAAETLTVTDKNIGLSWTDKSGSRGSVSWSASGSTVTGKATGYTHWFSPYSVETKLTITNNYSDDRTLSFDYSLTGGGSVSGTISGTSGSYSDTLAAGASTTITLTSPSGSSTNTLTISGLQLLYSGNVTSTFLAPENGSYTVDGAEITVLTTKEKATSDAYALKATPASGYDFFGWWSNANNNYVSYANPANVKFGSDPQLKPVFISSGTALFGVGSARFYNLTEAANYALSQTDKKVVLLNNGTLRGEHTIPAGVTLLIPFNDANTLYTNTPGCTTSTANNVAWVKPTAYRTLTMAADAKITVNGAMSLSAQHAAANGGANYCGSPTGPVSFVNMQEGSNITVNNGGNLYAWGFITGSGSVTANSGSTVYENFQITDFRGGNATMQYASAGLAFPLNQYYVQNIEVPVTFYAGASEKIYTSAYSNYIHLGGEATFIGAGGMFTSSEDGYVVKDYDESSDRLIVDLYGSCELNSMTVNLSIEVDSGDYLLPITNNVTINIHSGTTTLKQSVALLPGVELTVDNGAVLDLAYTDKPINDYCSAGYNIIVYDRDEWFYGINMDNGAEVTGTKYGNVLHSSAAVPNGYSAKPSNFVPVLYAPGRTGGRTDADLKDAVVDVNGTIISNGFLYTTVGGASIISSEKTGVIEMVGGSGMDGATFQNNGTVGKDGILAIMIQSASLMNGDGTYLVTGPSIEDETIPVTEPGTVFEYCATHDKWYTGECEKCNSCDHVDVSPKDHNCDDCEKPISNCEENLESVSAKPATCTETGNIDHYKCKVCGKTYVEVYGSLEEGDPTQPKNTTNHTGTKVTYTYTEASHSATYDCCGTAYVTNENHDYSGDGICICGSRVGTEVTWIVNGKSITAGYTYGATPAYPSEMPGAPALTKAPDANAHYTFKGWATTENGSAITLPAVTNNVTYYAVFTSENHNDDKIEGGRHYCTVCNFNIGSCADNDNDHKCDVGGEDMACHLGILTKQNGQNPTCGKDGWNAYYKCSCDKFYADNQAQTLISNLAAWKTGDGKISATGNHTPGTAADCVNNQTCTVCGKELNAALGHSFTTVAANAATCQAGGNVEYKQCTVCNLYFAADAAVNSTEGKENNADFLTNADPNNHANKPTYTTNGDSTHNSVYECCNTTGVTNEKHFIGSNVCQKCGAKQFKVLLATAGWITDWKANALVIYKNGLIADYVSTNKSDTHIYYTVEYNPADEYEIRWMKGGDFEVDNDRCYIIALIGNETLFEYRGNELLALADGQRLYPECTGHNYSDATCDAPATCTECGATTGDKLGHSFTNYVSDGNATCTADGTKTAKCDRCDATDTVADVGSALKHSFTKYVSNNDATCTADGTKTAKCDRCDATDTVDDEGSALDHSFTKYVSNNDATCIADGTKTAKCDRCDATDTVADEGSALKHSFTKYVSNNDATCIADGTKTAKCDRCDATDTITDEDSALDHSWKVSEYIINDDATHTANYVCDRDASHTKSDSHVAHSYVDHVCACTDVEKFTLTVWIDDEHVFKVPFGAKIMDVINANASALGFDAEGIKIVWLNSQSSGEFGFVKHNINSFSYEGYPIDEKTMPSEDITVIASPNFTGWSVYETDGVSGYTDNDRVTYVNDGCPIDTAGWYKLPVFDFDAAPGTVSGTAWYYIEEVEYESYGSSDTGYFRVEGVIRVPYPTVAINGITYAPNYEDVANGGETFKDKDKALFVFDNDGKFNTASGMVTYNGAKRWSSNGMIQWHVGLVEIDGAYYYFLGDAVNGGNIMATGDIYVGRNTTERNVTIGGIYTFGEDGILCEYDGIENVNGILRYYEDAQLMKGKGLIKVDGDYYYVRSNGALAVNTTYWVSNVNEYKDIPVGSYSFDANGKMDVSHLVKNGIVNENGVLKYYDNGKLMYNAGLVKLDNGKYIYVRSNGQLATGKYWITNTNGYETEGFYEFGTDGYMLDLKNGIYDGKYYVDGNIAYNAGVIEIDGKYYYVRSNGQLATGTYWITNVGETGVIAKEYTFAADGSFEPEFAEEWDGVVDGYYYIDGQIMYGAGLVELEDGRYIYVRSNGQLATGIYWATNHNDLLPEGSYDFGTDGYMVSTERV